MSARALALVAFDFLLVAALVLVLLSAGCATVDQAPPIERTKTIEVKVPVPVPCLSDADRPALPKPTAVDPQTASTEQLAAAELADRLALAAYAKAVDSLLIRCSKGPGP